MPSFSKSSSTVHQTVKPHELFDLIKNRDWDAVCKLVFRHQEEVLRYNIIQLTQDNVEKEIECLAIHFACMRQAPVNVILALTAVSTETLIVKDSTGTLALHHACQYDASVDVIDLLLALHPEGAHVKVSKNGRLPLHYAAAYSSSTRVLQSLVHRFPEAVDEFDNSGYRPYHVASQFESVEDEFLQVLQPIQTHFGPLGVIIPSEIDSLPEAGDGRNTTNRGFSLFSHDLIPSQSRRHGTHNNSPSISSSSSSNSSLESCASSMSGKSESKKCVICLENDACRVMVPCGHVCLCNECGKRDGLDKCGWKCPECRSEIEMSCRIFSRVVND